MCGQESIQIFCFNKKEFKLKRHWGTGWMSRSFCHCTCASFGLILFFGSAATKPSCQISSHHWALHFSFLPLYWPIFCHLISNLELKSFVSCYSQQQWRLSFGNKWLQLPSNRVSALQSKVIESINFPCFLAKMHF